MEYPCDHISQRAKVSLQLTQMLIQILDLTQVLFIWAKNCVGRSKTLLSSPLPYPPPKYQRAKSVVRLCGSEVVKKFNWSRHQIPNMRKVTAKVRAVSTKTYMTALPAAPISSLMTLYKQVQCQVLLGQLLPCICKNVFLFIGGSLPLFPYKDGTTRLG